MSAKVASLHVRTPLGASHCNCAQIFIRCALSGSHPLPLESHWFTLNAFGLWNEECLEKNTLADTGRSGKLHTEMRFWTHTFQKYPYQRKLKCTAHTIHTEEEQKCLTKSIQSTWINCFHMRHFELSWQEEHSPTDPAHCPGVINDGLVGHFQ